MTGMPRILLRRCGIELVNARGIPGTCGGLVVGANGEEYFLCAYHVLYGAGAEDHDKVRARMADTSRRELTEIGRTVKGHLGRVRHGNATFFIDAAVGRLETTLGFGSKLGRALRSARRRLAVREACSGARVSKIGAVTGWTAGIVVDIAYPDSPYIGGAQYDAPNQLLIDPVDGSEEFSAAGDSGALVVDEQGCVIGLLWGTTAYGQGVACPIGPVLTTLDITLGGGER